MSAVVGRRAARCLPPRQAGAGKRSCLSCRGVWNMIHTVALPSVVQKSPIAAVAGNERVWCTPGVVGNACLLKDLLYTMLEASFGLA